MTGTLAEAMVCKVCMALSGWLAVMQSRASLSIHIISATLGGTQGEGEGARSSPWLGKPADVMQDVEHELVIVWLSARENFDGVDGARFDVVQW